MPAEGKVVPWHRCLLVALPGWLVVRVIVLSAFALANAPTPLVWDAAWYRDLGVQGYGPAGPEAARFFPLLPAVVAVGVNLGVPAALWQVVVCWVAALFFAAALVRLTVRESGDEAAGHRVAWLIQLVPGASILAFGYAEALAGLLAVLYFLALRSPRGAPVGVAAGVLSGLARPTGPVLALPGLVEAVRSRRRGADSGGDQARGEAKDRGEARSSEGTSGGEGRRAGEGQSGERPKDGDGRKGGDDRRQGTSDKDKGGPGRRGGQGRGGVRWAVWLVAVAPLVGTGGYLAWAGWTFGDPLTPYRAHATTNPPGDTTAEELLTHTSPGGYPWSLVLALLGATGVALYLCGRRLPFAYLAWTVPMVGLAVIAGGLSSLPRYLAAVFPLWMSLAITVRDRRLWLTVMTASLVGFTWVAWLTVVPGGPVP